MVNKYLNALGKLAECLKNISIQVDNDGHNSLVIFSLWGQALCSVFYLDYPVSGFASTLITKALL